MNKPAPRRQRIVCLGDSITDGNTYAQLIMQALAEAGQEVPACICSDVSGDSAQQMDIEVRADRRCLPARPCDFQRRDERRHPRPPARATERGSGA